MDLYLMQHGVSNPKEKDTEEGLSEEGKKAVLKSAWALKNMNISFDVIICSPKKRSIQTAQIIAKEFNYPEGKIVETDKVKPTTPAEETLEFISQYERVFIAGHLPSIKEIISYLLSPTNTVDIDIQNAGCSRLEKNNEGCSLKWHLTPDILELISK